MANYGSGLYGSGIYGADQVVVSTSRATTWATKATVTATRATSWQVAQTSSIYETTLYESASATSVVLTRPASTATGDLLVAVIAHSSPLSLASSGGDNYSDTYADEYGDWLLAGHSESPSNAVAIFYKYATGVDGSTFTFPTAATPGRVSGTLTRVTGMLLGAAPDASVTASSVAVTTGLALPSLDTNYPNDLMFSAYTVNTAGTTVLTPPEMSPLANTSGTGIRLGVATESVDDPGATGTRTWGFTPTSTAYAQAAVQVAFRASVLVATRSTSWNVLSTVAPATRQTTWATGGKPTSTRQTSWTTRATVTPATRGTTWATLKTVSRSVLTSWSTFAQTTAATFVPGARLRLYAPNGATLGVLPAPQSISAAYPLNDVGSLTFSYLVRGPSSNLLGQPCEVALELSPDNGTSWFEPPDGRFIYTSDGRDPIDPIDKYDVTCTGYIQRFEKSQVLPNGLLNADGERQFLSKTPGAILNTLFTEAQLRGELTGITYTFSPGVDSAGASWAKVLTIAYAPGLLYLQILQNLADQGYVDFRMVGRILQVFNADTVMAGDKTVGAGQVTLRSGRDLTEAPFRRTWEGLADSAFFQGDKGVSYEYTNPGAETPWGRQSVFIANGSVTDPGTMAAITQATLNLSDHPRTEYTRGLDFTRSPHMPLRDYYVGDYIWSSVDGTAVPERLRVRQVTVTVSDLNVVSGNVVLNDRFLEADVRAKRKVDGITNGASGDAPVPGGPPEDNTDTTTPEQVGGLLGSSAPYLGFGGFTQAQVTLSWSAVILNTDGSPCDDLDHYEIYQRPGSSPVGSQQMVASTTETTYSMSPYVSATTWRFAVRAVDTSGHRGALSAETVVVMASDTTPPQAPSTPTIVSKLGVLHVMWDGLPVSGTWPGDFDHVDVHVSTTNNFTPSVGTYTDRMYGIGSTVVTGGTFGVPLYIKLVAVDRTGLQSVPSAQGTGVPSRLVGTDIDPGAITYEQIGFKDPGNVILDGSFEDLTFQAAVIAQSSPQWSFTTTAPFHGLYCATISGSNGASTYRNLFLMAAGDEQQIKAGEKLFCRMAYKAAVGSNGSLRMVINWYDAAGGLTQNVVTASTLNGTWQQVATQFTAPAGVAKFRFYIDLANNSTAGTFWVDAVEVRRTVGTAIIEDAAVGNAQINNLAVNSAKISDLDVGKLTTGQLNATVLIAGTLRTASAGARLEITGTGQRLYDAANNLKGWWDPSTGKMRIYNTEDATHTSTGHGMQFGDDTGQNLVIDNNEIMSRFNGTYGAELALNREGGHVQVGGKIGGFNPDLSDLGVFPADYDHQISLRAAVMILNVSDGDAADDYPPLLVGRQGGNHVWIDGNEIGAGRAGDLTSPLYILGPQNKNSNGNDIHHTNSVFVGSNSLQFRRGGDYNSGDRIGFIGGGDTATNVGLRFEGAGNSLIVKDRSNTGFNPIIASAFTVSSAAVTKRNRGDFEPMAILQGAKSERWQYRTDVERGDFWHYGPMLEDLPAEMKRQMGRLGEAGTELVEGYDVSSMVGILWEACRRLLARVRQLENRVTTLEGP